MENQVNIGMGFRTSILVEKYDAMGKIIYI
jgi:hypothetical protein